MELGQALNDALKQVDECVTLRAENDRLREALTTTLEHAMLHLLHLKEGFSVYDQAKEALK